MNFKSLFFAVMIITTITAKVAAMEDYGSGSVTTTDWVTTTR